MSRHLADALKLQKVAYHHSCSQKGVQLSDVRGATIVPAMLALFALLFFAGAVPDHQRVQLETITKLAVRSSDPVDDSMTVSLHRSRPTSIVAFELHNMVLVYTEQSTVNTCVGYINAQVQTINYCSAREKQTLLTSCRTL